jgi:hypothetical protein
LYTGKFFSVEEFQSLEETNALVKAQRDIANLTNALLISQNQVNVQQVTITELLNQNKAITSNDVEDADRIKTLQSTIDNLNQQVSTLSSDLALTLAAMQSDNSGSTDSQTIQTTLDSASSTANASSNGPPKPVTQSYQESALGNNKANLRDTDISKSNLD